MCLKIVLIPRIHFYLHPPFSILLTGLVRTPLQIYEYKAKNCDSDLLGVVEESGGQEQGLMKQGSPSWVLISSTAPKWAPVPLVSLQPGTSTPMI